VSELETLLKSFAESEGVGFGKFGPSLRGILTGGAQAPDLNKIMAALGTARSLWGDLTTPWRRAHEAL
jgi:glutamyl-tRNA synthetase